LAEETAVYMSAPEKNGTPALSRPPAPRGMMPSTWLNRTLRVEYADGFGASVEARATLLDLYPAGLVLSLAGSKTLLPWERIVLCELVEEGGG
jgi:hypothetical protein